MILPIVEGWGKFIQPSQVRMDLRVMALKGSTLPSDPELESHHWMQFSVISKIPPFWMSHMPLQWMQSVYSKLYPQGVLWNTFYQNVGSERFTGNAIFIYCHKKWWAVFKFWIKPFAFHFVLMPLGMAWIHPGMSK